MARFLSDKDVAVLQGVISKVNGGNTPTSTKLPRAGAPISSLTMMVATVAVVGEGFFTVTNLRVYGRGKKPKTPLYVYNTDGGTVTAGQVVTIGRRRNRARIDLPGGQYRYTSWELLPLADTLSMAVHFKLREARLQNPESNVGGLQFEATLTTANGVPIGDEDSENEEEQGRVTIKDPRRRCYGEAGAFGIAVQNAAGDYVVAAMEQKAYEVLVVLTSDWEYPGEGDDEAGWAYHVDQPRTPSAYGNAVDWAGPMHERNIPLHDGISEDSTEDDIEGEAAYNVKVYDPLFLAVGCTKGDLVRCRRVEFGFFHEPNDETYAYARYSVTETIVSSGIIKIVSEDKDYGEEAEPVSGQIYQAKLMKYENFGTNPQEQQYWKEVGSVNVFLLKGSSAFRVGDMYYAVRVGRHGIDAEENPKGTELWAIVGGAGDTAFDCLVTESLSAATVSPSIGDITPTNATALLYAGSVLTETEIEVIWRGESKTVGPGKALVGTGMKTARGYELNSVRCSTVDFNPS